MSEWSSKSSGKDILGEMLKLVNELDERMTRGKRLRMEMAREMRNALYVPLAAYLPLEPSPPPPRMVSDYLMQGFMMIRDTRPPRISIDGGVFRHDPPWVTQNPEWTNLYVEHMLDTIIGGAP